MSKIMSFTVEETNIIAIYKADTLAATLEQISAMLPYMEEDIRTIAENACQKLTKLTEQEFLDMSYTLADDMDGE